MAKGVPKQNQKFTQLKYFPTFSVVGVILDDWENSYDSDTNI